jgi:hypothetical protein
VFFKNKRKKYQQDLNKKVSEYQKWWQDQTEKFPISRSNFKKNEKSPRSRLRAGEKQKALDDSFVYYEGD